MTVNNEFERVQKIKVVQLTWNLPRRNEKRHEGPQDSRCPGRYSNWELIKHKLEALLPWKTGLIRVFADSYIYT